MTDHIYLSGIQLSQFRSFGELEIKLPAEPGVLIVYGSNGLGKSSLFDGLEWALTDGIDHFREARGVEKIGNYLSRWRDNPVGRTSVSMSFSDGAWLERSIASPQSTKSVLGGTVPDVTEYLRRPQWTRKISYLHRYLLLTHFLGQSTLSRLTHRASNERFDILKEAAQSSELEAIANALHGRGNTTMVRAYARNTQALDRDAEQFSELLNREAALWHVAEGSGSINNIEAYELVQKIVRLLGTSADLFYDLARDASAGEPDVAKIRKSIENALVSLRSRQNVLSDATHLVEGKQRLDVEAATIKAARAETDTQLSLLIDDLSRQNESLASKRTEADSALAELAGVRNRRDRLIELQERLKTGTELSARRQSIEAGLVEAERNLAITENRVRRLERTLGITRRLEAEVAYLDSEADRHVSEQDLCRQWILGSRQLSESRGALVQAETAHPNIETEIKDAEANLSDLDKSVKSQRSALDETRRAFGVISNAVAAIAANLSGDAVDCPVCDTRFEDSGVLQAKAATAAERIAPVIFSQEEAFSSVARLRDTAQSKLDSLNVARVQLQSLRNSFASSQARDAALMESIKHLRKEGEEIEDVVARLSRSIERLTERRERKRYWIKRLQPEDGSNLSAAISRAVRGRNDAFATKSHLLQTLSDNSTEMAVNENESASLITQVGNPKNLQEELVEVQKDFQTAESKADSIRREFESIASTISSMTANQVATKSRSDSLARQQSIQERELAELTLRWKGLELTSAEPEQTVIEAASQRLRAQERNIVGAEDLLSQLVAGRTAWANQITHRNSLEELRTAVGGAPNSSREELRQAAEQLRDIKVAGAIATRKTKDIAQEASNKLLTELEEFNAAFIRPLDDLMKKINQAILTDPRVGIGLHVNRKKIEQTALKDGEVPDAIRDIDPVLVHSEGQMSALAVSMLCAASLTFPWSRWRALVLDDPLQHNDGIHTSAFGDLISNLVSKREYQVLLSTHDFAQAEFLQRKFTARRIPCATLSLLGTGREGVETSFVPATSYKAPHRIEMGD